MSTADKLLSRLDKVRSNGDRKWMALCPAHDDGSPSLSLRELEDGRLLLHCFAGCGAADVLAAVGMELRDLYPERLGELSGKPYRRGENMPRKPAYDAMQDEIYRLRAKAGVR